MYKRAWTHVIHQLDEIGKKQLSVFGSREGQNCPLMHAALLFQDRSPRKYWYISINSYTLFQCRVVCISVMLFTTLKYFPFSAAIDGLADNDPIPPAIQQMLLVLQVCGSSTGADPGFLERGFIRLKFCCCFFFGGGGEGVVLLTLSLKYILKYPIKTK